MLIIKGLTKYFAKNSPHETLALDNFDLRIKKVILLRLSAVMVRASQHY
jgi:hypothetical protein